MTAIGDEDARTAQHGLVLLSNGFQSEYELGFANGLARNGLRPLLVCSDALPRERLDAGVTALCLRGSQDATRRASAKAANILRYWAATISLLRRQRAAVVHVIGFFTLLSAWAWLLEALALRLLAHRFVLTVHNVLPHDAHNAVNRLLFRLIYAVPHTLVVHTRRMSERLQREFGVRPGRIVVMEHGIDRIVPPSAGRRSWLREQCGLGSAQRIVLFFGNVAKYKGLDVLIQAFSRFPEGSQAVLVVAGRCLDAALKKDLQAGLGPLLASGRAFWFDGFVPEASVLDYFHGADLLAMPYRHIDQSGVVFMALATGLPVVASDVGSLAEYVPHTGGCVVAAGDPDGLAAAIDATLSRIDHVDRGRAVRDARRYLWSETVRPLIAAYGKTWGAA
jgi:glycosyltransferase involved in cell wall biosynthesis